MKCEFLRISTCAQILVLKVQQVNFLFVSLSFLHGKEKEKRICTKELKIAVGAKRGKQMKEKVHYKERRDIASLASSKL